MKVSGIITLHDEGEIAEKTIRALTLALEKTGVEYEIILHLDNASPETQETIKKFLGDEKVRIFKNNFRDVGPARNFAAEQARGEFLMFVDGDDLISENYAVKTLEILEKSDRETTVRPEFCVEFGDDGKGWALLRMEDSGTREEEAYRLFNINPWIVAIAGRREIFIKHPYPETRDGYGHEDYTMNIQLIEAGVRQKIAPGTIYFHRIKQFSRQKQHEAEHSTQPYSELFAVGYWRTFSSEIGTHGKDRRAQLKRIYVNLRKVLQPVAGMLQTTMSRKMLKERLPKTVAAEWDKVAAFEPKAQRRAKKMNAIGITGVNPYLPASTAYLKICQKWPDYQKIDLREVARGLDARNQDILISRIMVQSKGEAKFVDDKVIDEWKRKHAELSRVLGQ